MASRQPGFFVRHTEKIILAAAALFALLLVAVAWAGVFGSPASTRVGAEVVTPGTVAGVVQAEADKLRRALDETEPGVPDVTIPAYSDEFAERIVAPLLPPGLQRFVAMRSENGGLESGVFEERTTNFAAYHLPTPPMAKNAVVKAGKAVLAEVGGIADAAERERVLAVAGRLGLGPDRPGDFQYVSVMARFPLAEWARRLEEPDPDQAGKSIPRNVWRPRLGLASVQLLRQRLDPRTGQWSEAEAVPTLPGQIAYPPDRPSGAEDLTRAEQIVAELQARQVDVAQVPFPPTRHQPWTPPSGRDRVFTAAETARLAELEREIDNLENQLTRGSERQGATPRAPRSPRENRAGPEDGFEGGGPPSRRAPREAAEDPDQRRAERLREDLQTARNELNELLGLEPDAAVSSPLNGGGFFESSEQEFDDGRGFDGPERGGFDRGGGFGGPSPRGGGASAMRASATRVSPRRDRSPTR